MSSFYKSSFTTVEEKLAVEDFSLEEILEEINEAESEANTSNRIADEVDRALHVVEYLSVAESAKEDLGDKVSNKSLESARNTALASLGVSKEDIGLSLESEENIFLRVIKGIGALIGKAFELIVRIIGKVFTMFAPIADRYVESVKFLQEMDDRIFDEQLSRAIRKSPSTFSRLPVLNNKMLTIEEYINLVLNKATFMRSRCLGVLERVRKNFVKTVTSLRGTHPDNDLIDRNNDIYGQTDFKDISEMFQADFADFYTNLSIYCSKYESVGLPECKPSSFTRSLRDMMKGGSSFRLTYNQRDSDMLRVVFEPGEFIDPTTIRRSDLIRCISVRSTVFNTFNRLRRELQESIATINKERIEIENFIAKHKAFVFFNTAKHQDITKYMRAMNTIMHYLQLEITAVGRMETVYLNIINKIREA